MLSYPFNFEKISGNFIKRLNRFLVLCNVQNQETLAYLPNPGRLWELLTKDTSLVLIKNKPENKIPYTVISCYKNNQPILLHTHLTNKIIEHLIETKKIPFLQNYSIFSKEVKYKNSRFDLLLKNGEEEFFLEIKTCTLFGNNIAMFPDAVTERGKRHLIELNELSKDGKKSGILFVVMDSKVKYFLPAYHIDLNFSKTLLTVKDSLLINAISLKWDEKFSFVENINLLNIPWDLIETEISDKGSYLLVLHIEENETITIGELGEILFEKGYYVYVGSALNSLSKRIARHKRKNKNLHWHIDYLTYVSKSIIDIPIITHQNLECFISQKISEISDKYIINFGSSDCKCKSHLYYFKNNPLENKNFINLVTFLRIDRLNKLLLSNF